ncbi:DUF4123 domain-containing protein [Intestinirhabdus alba]|uniref:DUF4123 domain-containing protein n=1 Tax=Intestinirhabdus alba TaxID=2899544 RepID=UPI001E33B9F6|nr:DUF4123 domain-containing protein [Intestinirhabdus alba]
MHNNMDHKVLQWITQLEQLCERLGMSAVYVIVDQAGNVPSLIQDLQHFRPAIDWVSLIENEPENEYLDDAPLFLRLNFSLDQHKAWLKILLRHYSDPARVLLFFSANDFKLLAGHLQRLTFTEWEGRKGLLRFYDTRIFPTLLSSILDEQQKSGFLNIARLWTWRDRDRHPVWLRGEYEGYEFSNDFLLTLSDAQYSQLGDISDIEFLSRNIIQNIQIIPDSPYLNICGMVCQRCLMKSLSIMRLFL